MTVLPPPSPIDYLIAPVLALAALLLWLAISVERHFHRWPFVTAGILLLILTFGHEHAWRPLAVMARMLHALLEGLGLRGVLALILVFIALGLGYPTVRRWQQRGRRRRKPSDEEPV